MAKKGKETTFQKPERKTRKELRKEQRLLKKQAKCRYFEMKRSKLMQVKNDSRQKISLENLDSNKKECRMNVENLNRVLVDKTPDTSKKLTKGEVPLKKTHETLLNKMKDQRKRQLLDANKEEEREMKYLEKKLKLANAKKVSSSKGFIDSGLDYILDVCDPERIHDSLSSEVNFEDSDSDFYEDYSVVQNINRNTNESSLSVKPDVVSVCSIGGNRNKKKVHFNLEDSSLSDDDHDQENYENSSDNSEDSDQEENGKPEDSDQDEEEDSEDNNQDEKSKSEHSVQDEKEISGGSDLDEEMLSDSYKIPNESRGDEVWEDIYGRLRDKKGNVVDANKGKYIPPQLRNIGGSVDSTKRREMLRLLKGLLNRLALNNMHSIASQVEELYSKNSRNSVNEALFTLFIDSIVSPVLSPERLIIDHAMLIALLHANVGSEIGAYMLQNFVNKFNMLLTTETPVENKELDNLLLFISYLYNFKVFEACLMFDILNKLCIQLSEKTIDLILVVLKSIGFPLRKDDPLAMKGFLLTVQKQVNQTTNVEDRSRMKYMLDILLNIKNNNISKFSDYDPAHHEHLKKVLKSVLRSGNSIVALRIGLEDLLKAEDRGRWWLVGSAWNKPTEVEAAKKENLSQEQFSAQLLALARKQNMNTDNRRNIFCILMSAEDYQDAFEKVLKLGLKGQQEREIPLVIVHCLLQEKNYNPYYAHIADQLCMSNRRHQMSFQCALWDRFRALEKLSSSQITLLSKFLAQLLVAGSLPISVLKVVEFTEVDKRHIRLLRQTILSIANEEAFDSMKQVFDRVSKSKKLSLFREALRLFIHHFILRNMPDGDLKERVLLINSILSGDT